jgi:hypothetical protein
MSRVTYIQPPFAASGYRGCPDSVLGRQRRVEYALMGRGGIRCTYAGTSVGELLLYQWLSGMSGIRPGIERLTSGSLKLRRWVTPRLSKFAESEANPLALPVPHAIGTKFSLSSGVIGYEFQSYVLAAFVSLRQCDRRSELTIQSYCHSVAWTALLHSSLPSPMKNPA